MDLALLVSMNSNYSVCSKSEGVGITDQSDCDYVTADVSFIRNPARL
jgi:hypothetical protein